MSLLPKINTYPPFFNDSITHSSTVSLGVSIGVKFAPIPRTDLSNHNTIRLLVLKGPIKTTAACIAFSIVYKPSLYLICLRQPHTFDMSHSSNVPAALPDLSSPSALSTQQNLVQVPVDLLNTLISRIAQLERSQASSLAGLRHEIAQLRRSTGVTFPQFSKLPKEIRHMIWEFALSVPQTHIMRGEIVSRSKINDVMQACSEARNRGFRLKLPYYQVGKARIPSPPGPSHGANGVTVARPLALPYKFLPNSPKFYMNLDADTIWVGQDIPFLPDCAEYFCGVCDNPIFFPSRENWTAAYEYRHRVDSKCQHETSLKRLAIHHKLWSDPYDGDESDEEAGESVDCLDLLLDMKPKELLIVVGDIGVARDRYVRFVPPNQQPWQIMPERGDNHPWRTMMVQRVTNRHQPTAAESWDLAATKIERMLESLKNQRAERRMIDIEVHGRHSEDVYPADISWWKVPKVTYVEAIPGDRNFIRPEKRFHNDK